MSDMPGDLNTALARPLYTALAWQFVVVVVVVIVAVLVHRLRRAQPNLATAEAVREPRGRRVLRVGLGLLWLIDGLLQAQPSMPSGFVSAMLNPQLADAPRWLVAWIDPFARLWQEHPVSADAATVWLQIGLGVGLLVGGSGRWSKGLVWASIAWAAFIWVFGEVLGGLTDPAASWLSGAPGAALFYGLGGVLLLLPWSSWNRPSAARAARSIVGLTLLAGALLQSIPRGEFWGRTGLAAVFDDAARGGIPSPLSTPIGWVSSHTGSAAYAANAILVAVLVIVGVGLLLDVAPRVLCGVAAALCALAWWFGQGLGVFGGLGTDPNTGLVLLLFLAAGWPREPVAALEPVESRPPGLGRLALVGTAIVVGCLLLLPVVTLTGLLRPVSAEAAVGDSGGLQAFTPAAAPPIALTDQHGRSLSLQQLHGKVVLVAFLDPVCFDDCPLLANQLATAVGLLGTAGRDVQILAVDVNPTFHSVQDVRTFTNEHGLAGLPNWHFVTGSNAAVGDVLASYGQGVSVPRVGMIGHPEAIYLIDRDGDAVGVLNDTANANLTRSYAQLMAEQVRPYL